MNEFFNWWALQEEDSNLAEFHAGAAWVASAERFKPKWENAPDWANWLAMDKDGEWNWFISEPLQLLFYWENWEDYEEDQLAAYSKEFCKMYNWKETLEQRPE